ncbi:MAG: hypothetical protein UT05_C0005G0030 [Parcubacteria group bacterium GW2011_GWF2_38_76]|nr:MAG: hypothetical protein UT05_C0005G0030 [Parcubacteria group bacterium GW2011_GWF2_38_76]HBM45600.1 hypothetical protein [Patescibacteria group bacterium]
MGESIYGVDKQGDYGPKDVLRAIENCFVDAHKDVIDSFLSEGSGGLSEEEKDKMRKLDVHYLVKGIIEKDGGDYENPTKKNLQYLIDQLKNFSKNFRNPEIVEKHYFAIKGLIDILK